MANFSEILAKGSRAICTKLFNSFKDDTAKLMIASSAIGLILAGAANTIGIAINKNTTKKEKQYLVPMELTDSLMSLTTFYFASSSTKKLAEKLVDNKTIDLSNAKSPMAKSGVTIIATILGSVIASNILTPIIRNNVGAKIQKKLMSNAGVNGNNQQEVKHIYHPLPNNGLNIPQNINAYKTYVSKSNLTV